RGAALIGFFPVFLYKDANIRIILQRWYLLFRLVICNMIIDKALKCLVLSSSCRQNSMRKRCVKLNTKAPSLQTRGAFLIICNYMGVFLKSFSWSLFVTEHHMS